MSKQPTFEQAIEKLEAITRQLEDPATSLDQSILAFEEGVSLIRFCRETLSKAEARISVLTDDEDNEEHDAF